MACPDKCIVFSLARQYYNCTCFGKNYDGTMLGECDILAPNDITIPVLFAFSIIGFVLCVLHLLPCWLEMRNKTKNEAQQIAPAKWLEPVYDFVDGDIMFFITWIYSFVIIIVWSIIGFAGFVWISEGKVKNWYNEDCEHFVDISEDTYTLWILTIIFAGLSIVVEIMLCKRCCERCPVSDYEPSEASRSKNNGIRNASRRVGRF